MSRSSLVLAALLAAAGEPVAPAALDSAPTPLQDAAPEGPAADPAELWAAGRREAALALWAAELARRPDDAGLRLALAEREVLARRYRAALAHLAPIPAPTAGADGADADVRARARRLRGHARYFLGEYAAALDALDPDEAADALLRVAALEALGRMDAWRAAIERAAALLGPEDPGVLVLRGRARLEAGDAAGAVPLFRAAVAAEPSDGAALFGLGRALVASGERDEGLAVLARHRELLPLLDELEFVRRGLDLAPAHAPQHAGLGDVLRRLGRLDDAERAYGRAWELARGAEVVPIALRLARFVAEDRGRPADAARIADAAAERVPDVRLLVRAGDLWHAAGADAAARERYRAALAARPDDRAIRARLERLGPAGEGDDGEGDDGEGGGR